MSRREDRHHHLLGQQRRPVCEQDLDARLTSLLDAKMHGIAFSAYTEGQTPGDRLSRDQIERRMAIIAPHFKWIRAFSVTEGNELIPLVAKEMGLNTLVGAWLGTDSAKNREEIDTLVALAHEGVVDVAAVGNEVLYRDELSEDELLDYMADAGRGSPPVFPGYVDAYYEFEDRPGVTDACDVILSNCYPFWEVALTPTPFCICRTCTGGYKKWRAASASSLPRRAGPALADISMVLNLRHREPIFTF